MTHDEFTALVSRLDDQARKHPAGYRRRVVLLAFLGNAYLAVMLLLIGALFVGALASIFFLKAVGVKLALVIGFFLWMILKALNIRMLPPEGTEIRSQDAPALFAMIDELRARLGAPRFHHVLVTDDFNAGVVQSPRLGIFGWPRNYLLIGLPLMKALSPEQFKAVLAHEFGHLARNHGRLSNWIYRQRLRWGRLIGALEASESSGGFLFKPFLKWYSPYFNAYSFPLARANEYEADATSARLTSPQVAAQALTGVEVVAGYLGEQYWPNIHKQADEQAHPGFSPFSGMGQQVVADLDDASAATRIEKALARETTLDDTHPSLRDRLDAMGETARLAKPAPGAAADQLLGPSLPTLTEAFDRRWQDSILPSWQERHRHVQEGRRRLAELNEEEARGTQLAVDDAYERASLTDRFGNDDDGTVVQLRALLERAPDDVRINFHLGARLLDRDDDSGRALVERAGTLDENILARTLEYVRDYLWRIGRKEEAQAVHRKLMERVELEQAAQKERDQVTLSDKFEPPGLPGEELEALRKQLSAVPGLKKGYFVRKRVKHLPHRPSYVFGFTVAAFTGRNKKAAEVLGAIQEMVRFPAETMIVHVQGGNRRFGRKFRWMRGSRLL